MENRDANGAAHYPGWSLPALKYLYEERKIAASGHETTDTGPGIATSKDDYSRETYILSTNHYQIELLTNLNQVPEAGAIAVVSFPKPKGARVVLRECLRFCPDLISGLHKYSQGPVKLPMRRVDQKSPQDRR
jgi:kynurenine formamidase